MVRFRDFYFCHEAKGSKPPQWIAKFIIIRDYLENREVALLIKFIIDFPIEEYAVNYSRKRSIILRLHEIKKGIKSFLLNKNVLRLKFSPYCSTT